MTKQTIETTTLQEIITDLGLATTQEDIDQALNCATRGNEFYVGTDVRQWLSRFEILTQDDMIERFSAFEDSEKYDIPDSWLIHELDITLHDNSYNWSGKSNCDIDFKLLQDENQNSYAYVRIHIGGDIRGNYTEGILVDLDTYYTDSFYNFIDSINEVGNGAYVEIDGTAYSIDGDITNEYLSIYNHSTHESYDVCDSIYEFDQEGFEKAVKEIVLEAIEQNK